MALMTKTDQEYLFYADASPGEDVRQEIADYYGMDAGITLADAKFAYYELGLDEDD